MLTNPGDKLVIPAAAHERLPAAQKRLVSGSPHARRLRSIALQSALQVVLRVLSTKQANTSALHCLAPPCNPVPACPAEIGTLAQDIRCVSRTSEISSRRSAGASAAAAGCRRSLLPPLPAAAAPPHFSADGISRLQAAAFTWEGRRYATITGKRITEAKLHRDLAPNIAALQVEGLDTASVEWLFRRRPKLLTTAHATFSSSLAALRQLAALLPDDPRAVQAPAGATQLGAALWLYPTAAAHLLARVNLASLIDGNLRLRRQLGISDAKTAAAFFRQQAVLVTNFERAEAMVAHVQRQQASGELSQEQGEQAAAA